MMTINELLPGVKEQIPLKEYTTFKIGGPARYFYTAIITDDLVRAVTTAKETNTPYYLLGSGANILVSDQGFDGLVILAKNDSLTIDGMTVKAGSGVPIGKLVLSTVAAGLSGIECWAGIPGTVGGSVFGNMGLPAAEKGQMSDWITEVEVLRDGDRLTLQNKACGFGYRTSIFKTNSDIILSATFELENAKDITTLKDSMKSYQKKKLTEQPLELPSSGCIFKNPEGLHAGKLIDELGLKGKRIGGAEVSQKHGNFINNVDNATAEDVITLISLIKQKVRDKYRIQLEEEINLVGF